MRQNRNMKIDIQRCKGGSTVSFMNKSFLANMQVFQFIIVTFGPGTVIVYYCQYDILVFMDPSRLLELKTSALGRISRISIIF